MLAKNQPNKIALSHQGINSDSQRYNQQVKLQKSLQQSASYEFQQQQSLLKIKRQAQVPQGFQYSSNRSKDNGSGKFSFQKRFFEERDCKDHSQIFSRTSIRPVYTDFKRTYNHANLCLIPLPYTLSNQNQNMFVSSQSSNKFQRKCHQKILISIQNKLKNEQSKNSKQKNDDYAFDSIKDRQLAEIPINQYLSYDLSQEINVGIKNAQILADQIKVIREKKRIQRTMGSSSQPGLMSKNSPELNHGKNLRIKIVHGFSKNYKGLYMNSNAILKV